MIARKRKWESKLVQYMDDVRCGRRIAGKLEIDMVQRFDDDRRAEREDGEFPYRLDHDKAERCCEFIAKFKHTDGEYAGQPFELYPWQVFIVYNLIGWVDKETGFRRFAEAFISIGRGNGKSPFGAVLMLYLFLADGEARAEIVCAAVKRDQAAIVFEAAKRFVSATPLKDEYVTVLTRELVYKANASTFVPLSSDVKSADGGNTHGLLIDELHAWPVHQRPYLEKLRTGTGKRRQPLSIVISTAGDDESELWREERSFAAQCVSRDSPIDQASLFVAIYEMDDDDSEHDERSWHKANPMLEFGVVKIRYLKDLSQKAQVNIEKLHELRRYHCNKLARSLSKAITEEVWAKGAQPIPWDEINDVFSGIDLGLNDDLAAIGYVAPLDWISVEGKSKRRYAAWCESWIPAGTKRDITREPFASWLRTGRLVRTDSEWTDTAPMYDELEKTKERYGIRSVAYDPANFSEFAGNCTNTMGLEVFAFHQQHAKYNEPVKEFLIAMSEGRILHANDSLLAWAMMNMILVKNAKGHVMPNKDRSDDKIDPAVAVIMAFAEALFAERDNGSVYEHRDPIILG